MEVNKSITEVNLSSLGIHRFRYYDHEADEVRCLWEKFLCAETIIEHRKLERIVFYFGIGDENVCNEGPTNPHEVSFPFQGICLHPVFWEVKDIERFCRRNQAAKVSSRQRFGTWATKRRLKTQSEDFVRYPKGWSFLVSRHINGC